MPSLTITVGGNVGKYLILSYRGQGAFGQVYEARDRAVNDHCAIKFIKISPTGPFADVLAEAQNLRLAAGQHIVRINGADIFWSGGERYVGLDMEFLPDGSVEGRAAGTGLSFREVLTATRHTLLGLTAAHIVGVIHRDVKPANIMISGSDYKLSDFGVSRLKTAMIGQPEFYPINAAPELLRTGIATERSDIYATGVTLFRLCGLKGDISIPDGTFNAWEASGMTVGLPEFIGFPDHVPLRIRKVIRKATSANDADRYASAAEMLEAVEQLKLGIAWRKVSETEWCGLGARGECFLTLSPKAGRWALEFKRNGRRVGTECSQHLSEAAGKKALARKVSQSLLA